LVAVLRLGECLHAPQHIAHGGIAETLRIKVIDRLFRVCPAIPQPPFGQCNIFEDGHRPGSGVVAHRSGDNGESNKKSISILSINKIANIDN
jgi:hypothetical protein